MNNPKEHTVYYTEKSIAVLMLSDHKYFTICVLLPVSLNYKINTNRTLSERGNVLKCFSLCPRKKKKS